MILSDDTFVRSSAKTTKSANLPSSMVPLIFSSKVDESYSVKDIMRRVNRPLYFKTEKKVFTALCLASIDLLTKELTFTNAGLYDPLLISEGSVSEIKGKGNKIPLGVKVDIEYMETKLKLKSGDVMVFVTDGITESKNQINEFYGYDTLKKILKEMGVSSLTAKDIKSKIIEDVKNFSESTSQHDDMTVVVVKML